MSSHTMDLDLNRSIQMTLFSPDMKKSEQTKVRILEGAIKCYSKYGLEKTNYDQIAKAAKVTRPLIIHYFPQKQALLEMTFKYIRAICQNLAINAIKDSDDPITQLKSYVLITFDWAKDYPD